MWWSKKIFDKFSTQAKNIFSQKGKCLSVQRRQLMFLHKMKNLSFFFQIFWWYNNIHFYNKIFERSHWNKYANIFGWLLFTMYKCRQQLIWFLLKLYYLKNIACMSGYSLIASREDVDVYKPWKSSFLKVAYNILCAGDNQAPSISWNYIGYLTKCLKKNHWSRKKQADNYMET